MHASAENDLSWLPAPGTLIADRYRLISLLGAGGMATVLMAEHVHMGDRVAIKFLHPRVAAHGESLQRFLREARISSLVKSEHVVRTIDVGTTPEGLSFLVMEYLEGEDLSARLNRAGPYPIQLAVDCVLQAAEALSLAHAAGVVHRDIKPSNLWLAARQDGSPLLKVLDFGISKLAPGANSDPSLTETASVFGSPTYMSPEQIRSAKRVGAGTDVWALGIVLHELLTAQLPFEGDNVGGILASITADAPQSVRVLREEVPPVIEEVVLACLEKDPARRISLAELCAELRPFGSAAGVTSAGRVLAAPAPSSAQPEWRARSTRTGPGTGASTLSAATIRQEPAAVRTSRLLKGGGAVVALAAVGALAWALRKTPDEPPRAEATPLPSAAATVTTTTASVAPAVSAVPSAPAPSPSAAPLGKPTVPGGKSAPVPSAVALVAKPAASAEPPPVVPKPAGSRQQVSDDRQ